MDDIYTYVVPLPPKVNEMVTPCIDGYTVYISDRLDREGQKKAYAHAVEHIKNNDFSVSKRVETVEAISHSLNPKKPAERTIRAKKRKSLYDKYLARQKRREKAFEKLGMRTERYFADDEYGCPRVRTRVRW